VINLTWTVLTKGKIWTIPEYGRRSEPFFYERNREMEPILDLFIPFRDNLLQSFYSEEMLDLLLSSDLRTRTLEFDPVNTYERSTMQFPEPGFDTDSPVTIVPLVGPTAFTDFGDGILRLICNVVVATPSITTRFGTQNFTMTNNLSSIITLTPGFDIRFQGALPGGDFSFFVEFTADPRVDWEALLIQADNGNWNFEDPELREMYKEDAFWNNRLAALLLNAVENSHG